MTGRLPPLLEIVPENARLSGVLILFFPKDEVLQMLFIRRAEDGRAHGGQIAFPGGKHELTDSDLQATALREAQEETGVLPNEVVILGPLTPLYIPVSNFMVHPFIGYTRKPPTYLLSEEEVAGIIEVPADFLFNPENKFTTIVRPNIRPGMEFIVPAYRLPEGGFIWGATAMILSELEEVWKGMK